MADSQDDIVSNVAVTGVDETSSELKKMADDGAAAFDKLAQAVKDAADKIAGSTKGISSGLEEVNKAAPDDKVPSRIKAIEDSIISLKGSIGSSVSKITSFTASVAAIGAAGLASIVGIAKFAASTTAAFRDIGEVTKDQLRTQQALDRQNVTSVQNAATYDDAIGKLTDQLRAGKLTYGDYGNAIKALDKEQAKQLKTQEAVAAAEEDNRKKNDAALRAQQQLVAITALEKAYGGPLTQSLISLGQTYDDLHKQVVNAFSPALSSLVDAVSAVIDKNRGAITKFIDDAAKALENFIKNNGPAITEFFGLMVDVIRGVGTVIMDVVIPAFKAMFDIAGKIAEGINNIFGTKFTAGTVIAAAAIVAFSGAISGAIAVVSTIITVVTGMVAVFGGLGTIIAIVVIALIAFAATVNWTKLGSDVQTAFTSLINFFTQLPGRIGAFFTTLWESTKSGATTAVQFIVDAWNAVVTFFTNLPTTIITIFTTLWALIVAGAQIVAQQIITAWDATVNFFKSLPTTIGAFLSQLWDGAKSLAASAAQAITDAFNAVVQFFSGLPATVLGFFSQLWDSVTNATQAAFDGLKAIVTGWVQSVLSFLQPVLDAIKAVNDFIASGAANEAQGGPAFAGGGHVRGAGSSTSDSIAAWLSDNEYVVKAKAVAKYGVRFMNLINSGKLDLGGMMRFAAGGLVQSLQGNQAPRLAFATGGPVNAQASRVLNLTIGDQQFNGLLMPEDVANKMTKYAVTKQTQSAGRKPSWVGGRR